MNRFERYLSVRVFLCIIAGILPAHGLHAIFESPGAMYIARFNLPVAVLVEVPVMLSVVRIVNRTQSWYEAGAGRHAIHHRPGNQTVADTADNSHIP